MAEASALHELFPRYLESWKCSHKLSN